MVSGYNSNLELISNVKVPDVDLHLLEKFTKKYIADELAKEGTFVKLLI
jgi:hypothetical protein